MARNMRLPNFILSRQTAERCEFPQGASLRRLLPGKAFADGDREVREDTRLEDARHKRRTRNQSHEELDPSPTLPGDNGDDEVKPEKLKL